MCAMSPARPHLSRKSGVLHDPLHLVRAADEHCFRLHNVDEFRECLHGGEFGEQRFGSGRDESYPLKYPWKYSPGQYYKLNRPARTYLSDAFTRFLLAFVCWRVGKFAIWLRERGVRVPSRVEGDGFVAWFAGNASHEAHVREAFRNKQDITHTSRIIN